MDRPDEMEWRRRTDRRGERGMREREREREEERERPDAKGDALFTVMKA